jgi:hypothetical protein
MIFHRWYPHANITARVLETTQTRNTNFVETCFTGGTEFIAVRYLVINSGLSSNNRLSYKSNLVKVSRIGLQVEAEVEEFVKNVFKNFKVLI